MFNSSVHNTQKISKITISDLSRDGGWISLVVASASLGQTEYGSDLTTETDFTFFCENVDAFTADLHAKLTEAIKEKAAQNE